MAEVKVTRENFADEVLASDIPVLVDFWATWCGPCRMIAPELSSIAEEQEGKIKVCKVNVDEEGELAQKFGIMSIPTILCFKRGEIVGKQIGYCNKAVLLALVENN